MAIIELSPTSAEILATDWPTPNVFIKPVEGAGSPVCLVGFPSVRNTMDGRGNTTMRPVAVATSITKRGIQYDVVTGRPSDPEADLWVEYPPGEILDIETGKQILFEPDGLSGAGVFGFPVASTSELWAPVPVLVGIQVAFLRSSRVLRATRLERVMELLRSS